jgi:hypothetical protein
MEVDMLRLTNLDCVKLSALVVGLILFGATPESANATTITFTGEYTGTFTGGIVGGPSPIILLSSGNGTVATAAYNLTNVSFSHNTSITSFTPPFPTQTIYNGSLTLSGGGNGIGGSYTGTFQLFADTSGGTIHLDLTDLIGSGVLAGYAGSGTADGTVAFTPILPPIGFDGTFDVTVNATLSNTPLPSALPLFASGLGVMGLLGWRRKRKAAALAA